jgi:hypothetical protein
MKKVQALARHWSDYFYGFSTGVLCTTTTAATQSSGAYTLATGYGQATITGAALLADKFKVNDAVALIRAGALVTNAIGTVTGVTAGHPVDRRHVERLGRLHDRRPGRQGELDREHHARRDRLQPRHDRAARRVAVDVGARPLERLGEQLERRVSDTAADGFSGIMLHRANDEIRFNGGGKVDLVIIAPGVYRDVLSLQQAALRFQDPFALELDGQIKSQGVKFFSSKRVPGSWVWALDPTSYRKLDVMPKPGTSGPGATASGWRTARATSSRCRCSRRWSAPTGRTSRTSTARSSSKPRPTGGGSNPAA